MARHAPERRSGHTRSEDRAGTPGQAGRGRGHETRRADEGPDATRQLALSEPRLLEASLAALLECRLVTTGRVSGQPREIEIWFAAIGDRLVMLAGGRHRAHWVRNLIADPTVRVRLGPRTFVGRARVIEGEPDDPAARDAIAAKYGTTGLKAWLRDSLPVAIDLEREVGA
jgi:deazaflavin-dependent oxidoreductase (nitroreductase family)